MSEKVIGGEIGQIIGADGAFGEGWTEILPESLRSNEAFGEVKSISELAEGFIASRQPKEFTMEDYIKGLDEDFAKENEETLKRFKQPGEIFKSYAELRKIASKKGDIPQDGAGEDEWNEFFGKLGRPEAPDGYELQVPEELGLGDEYVSKLKEAMHGANMTKGQAAKFFEDMAGYEVSIAKAMKEEYEAKEQERQARVEKEWGSAVNEMRTAVESTAKFFGASEEDMAEIANSPGMLILLGKIAKQLDEKGQIGHAFSMTNSGSEDLIAAKESEIIERYNKNPQDPMIDRLQREVREIKERTGRYIKKS